MTAPNTPISFEQLIRAAQLDGDYKPVWRQFVRTRFFTPLLPASDGALDRLRVLPNQNDGKPWLLLAQQMARLELEAGHEAKAMYGGEVIKKLAPGVAIGVALGKGVFNIPANFVDGMRKSMEAAAQAKKAQSAPAPTVPVPVPAQALAPAASAFPTINAGFPSLDVQTAEPKPAAPKPAAPPKTAVWDDDLIDRDLLVAQSASATPATAPTPTPTPTPAPAPRQAPVARAQWKLQGDDDDDGLIDPALIAPKSVVAKGAAKAGGPLDVQTLAPRNVVDAALGLDFYVPGAWKQSRSGKAIQFLDPATQAKIEITCMQRAGTTLENWLALRLPTVTKEMPFLQQVGDSYQVFGSQWRGRIEAMATEYKGTFHLDDEETHYLICCYRTDSAVVAMTVRVKSKAFEDNRALYKWLFERVNIAEPVAVEVVTNRDESGRRNDGPTPAMWGFSTDGRIGRLRYFAYSLVIWLPMVLLILATTLVVRGFGLGAITIILTTLWMPIRLVVMRLHDLNRSGWWLLALLALPGLAGAKQSPVLLGLLSGLFWLALFVISVWPGEDDDNDFGPPCSPNPMWVNVVAGGFVLLQMVGLGGGVLMGVRGKSPWQSTEVADVAPLKSYTPRDGSFTVVLPGIPKKDKMAGNKPEGFEELQIYRLSSGSNKYYIEISKMREELEKNTDALDYYRDSMLPTHDTVIEAEKRVRVGEFTGRQIRFALPDGRHQDFRLLIAGAKVYMVSVESTKESRNQDKIDMVLESFRPN